MDTLDYEPVKALTEEVERFKATNRFTPMLVTGFYLQAAVVLNILAATQAELDGADKVIARLKVALAAEGQTLLEQSVKERGLAYVDSFCLGWLNSRQGVTKERVREIPDPNGGFSDGWNAREKQQNNPLVP